MEKKCTRRIPLRSIQNCRDLGGYACDDGNTTQFAQFLRAGIFFGPLPWDMQQLEERFPVRTVIDLRGTHEATNAVSAYKNNESVDYYNYSLMNINPVDPTNDDVEMWQLYTSILETKKEIFLTILKTIADAKDGTILYHCSLGKDRTGMLSALLLTIAGADKTDIIADYEQSETYLRPFYESMKDEESSDSINIEHLHSNPDNMYRVFDYANEKYGGLNGYLAHIGLDDETRSKIEKRLKG